jgi:hypothetical protein
LKIVVREEIRFKPIKTGKRLIPAIVPPPRKTFLTKRSPPLTVDEFEDCIENREGTYPGH